MLFRGEEEKGPYRLDSKQGQRGVQEAQTCTQSEDCVADQHYFRSGEEAQEGVLGGVGI